MRVEITFRVAPESRGELIDSYAGKYRELRQQVERLQEVGALPGDAKVHWLLVSGRWE